MPSFYEALSRCGGIARRDLDWESGNLYGNWTAIFPLFEHLIREAKLADWQYKIVCALTHYEAHRLHFLSDSAPPTNGILASGENWVAFPSVIQLNETLGRIRSSLELTSEVLREGLVVLVRYPGRKFAAYALDSSLLPDLMRQSPELFNALGLHRREERTCSSEGGGV